jgi:hypothetical protein
MTACFAATYGLACGMPTTPRFEALLTIDPPPASSSAGTSCFTE